MKKIVFFIPRLYGGGAERVTAVLANGICGISGYEVHMISYKQRENDYALDEKIRKHSAETFLNGGGHQSISKIKYLRKTIKEIDPHCVVSLAGPGAIGLLAVSMIGTEIPLVLSERNDPKSYPEEKILRAVRWLAYRLCSGVVFQTEEAKNFFSSAVKKKSTVIHNPIVCELPERSGKRDHRIINWCRLNSQKNLDLLIDSFADISSDFPDYILEIYGEGPEEKRLTEKIRDIDLENRIYLRGFSSEIHSKAVDASLFVSSSDFEGISNSMLEAIAMGIPSICTDCPSGGARETIENGVNGILVPVGDRKEMAKAMKRVLSDEKLSERIGSEGKKLKEKLSVSSVLKLWLDFIDTTVGKTK